MHSPLALKGINMLKPIYLAMARTREFGSRKHMSRSMVKMYLSTLCSTHSVREIDIHSSIAADEDDHVPGILIPIAEPAHDHLTRFCQFIIFAKVCQNTITDDGPATAHIYTPFELSGKSIPQYTFGLSCSAPNPTEKNDVREERAKSYRMLHATKESKDNQGVNFEALESEVKEAKRKFNKSRPKGKDAKRVNDFYPIGNRAEWLCLIWCVAGA